MENADTFASTRPSERLMRGIATASRAHDGHYRKGSGVPYISHPMAVMLIAASVTNDEDVLLAALFHDILEDVPENYSRAEMEDEFGPRVVEIVEGVTKDSSLPSWQERADAYLEQLSRGSAESIIVAAADKFHNLSQTLEDLDREGHSLWRRFRSTSSQQLWWYTNVRNVIAERLPDMPLLDDLDILIERLDSWVQAA
ncbi:MULTISPECIES: HD domain-containing protein [Corynebacterium]|uniref:HD domain-containing protein n=1 Tax=Corynebacterium amycolatum TaxID=43765 RepID=A0AB38XXE7_CORAY|nr:MULTISPECIES: HD domain-containing protein [Corynebacterium]AIN81933.1 HD domain protein [Corynebacterium sp. ATCC 6931]MBC6726538.1 bifunctional (p)ppGpp synthetase/guanosine-3',5'-bis(diphosphate) 3'-pyrophosphohydrolase [Corynebacterium amycolatum]MDY7341551.1 HD domain-containing protein [Corynebacterium amycolatum]OFU56258.1 guanosine polyphosphate pyrophosphohydrolase [Corynebacterium sp. HMSC11H10]QRP16536.1 bifunctional (p)ppGpp synthetase/guanosine-3',5'-bis(diphosphate) 3'-pyropho